jgi:phosphoribosylaminoimidazole-succinocarboxamide synthase
LETRGLILADTKFEFGRFKENIVLIDEILTPDSSRFWGAGNYEPGKPQESFDKQFVRDYLIKINWDKEPPAPNLPPEIIEQTRQRYIEAFQKITGKEFVPNHKTFEKVPVI